MSRYVKPIQPTPTLKGDDAKAIIKEALLAPTKESIEIIEKKLADSKVIFK